MSINKYLDSITSEHRDKPRFIAWLTATLNKTDDAYNCIKSIDPAFDLDNAIGKQLDTLGELIGVKRILVFQPLDMSPLLDDETYKLVLRAKIGKNNWQGNIPEIQDIWKGMFTDLGLDTIDNEDMSMTAVITGVLDELRELLIANNYIVPKPSGVRLNYVGKSPIKFPVYSSMVVCEDESTCTDMEVPKFPIDVSSKVAMTVCVDTSITVQ